MSPWSWTILLCTLLAFVLSIAFRNKVSFRVSSILLIAFSGTRVISEFVDGDRFMFDMSNDLVASLLLLYFVRESIVARAVILFYALMTTFAYIPSTLGYMPIHLHHILVDILAFIQIFFVFGGIIYGYRTTKPFTNPRGKSNMVGYIFDGPGGDYIDDYSKSERPDAQVSDLSSSSLEKGS